MNKLSKRFAAVGLIGAFLVAFALPAAMPARGQGPTAIAVATFENGAGAPYTAVEKLSDALYQAVASSGKYAAKGGGPLQIRPSVNGDPLAAAASEAAKFGADHVLVGNIVSYEGGQMLYALSLYTVNPVLLVRSQAFTQPYPASGQVLSAGFAANVAALEAPRTGTGTVTGVVGNNIRADLGQAEGFQLGQRFNVVHNGNVIAQAEIDEIVPDYATLEITNVSPNTAPVVGDRLVALQPQAVGTPYPLSEPNSFNPIALLFGIAVVLLAVGHHGTPVSFVPPSPTPTASAGAFTVTGAMTGGTTSNPVFTFTFSQPVSAADQTGIGGNTGKAFYTTQVPPAGTSPATPLSSLGPLSFDSTGTMLTVSVSSITLVPTEILNINLLNTITSDSGASLTATVFTFTASIARKPLNVTKPPSRSGSHPPGVSKPPAAPPRPAKPDRSGSGRQK